MKTIFYLFWLYVAIRNLYLVLLFIKCRVYEQYLIYRYGMKPEDISAINTKHRIAIENEYREDMRESHDFLANGNISFTLLNKIFEFMKTPDFYLSLIEMCFLFIGLFTASAIYFLLYILIFIIVKTMRQKDHDVNRVHRNHVFFIFIQVIILGAMLFQYFFPRI